MTQEYDLPPLPKGSCASDWGGRETGPCLHSDDEMLAYARTAIEADRQRTNSEAFRLLKALFTLWENGDACYQDGDRDDYIGNDFTLDDETFRQCVALLNSRQQGQPDRQRNGNCELLDLAMAIAHERELEVTGHKHDTEGAVRRFNAAVQCRGEPVDIRQEVIETLEMILAADWRKWEELASPDEFVRWAKSRANYALSIINKAPQPAEPVKVPSDDLDLAHEIWAAAQTAPGEGIEDAVARIATLLARRIEGES